MYTVNAQINTLGMGVHWSINGKQGFNIKVTLTIWQCYATDEHKNES